MELVKIGKNTKPTALKISGEIKNAFAKYLKAQQVLNAEEYKEVKVETLFASWLATFAASEEYKEVIAAAEAKAKEEKDCKNALLPSKGVLKAIPARAKNSKSRVPVTERSNSAKIFCRRIYHLFSKAI